MRNVTTNMVTISLSRLGNDSHLATGEAVFCSSCRALFNLFSKVVEKSELDEKSGKGQGEDGKGKEKGGEGEEEEGGQLWMCEFCGHINPVMLMDEEKPTTNEVDYILEVSSGVEKTKRIFVMDVSGSMCATTEMKGECPQRILDNAPKDEWADIEMEGFEMPKLPQGTWYLSRLQAIQSAISVQIDALENSSSCSLITFNNEVSIYGDATTNNPAASSSSSPASPSLSPLPYPIGITGDELDNQEVLLDKGKKQQILQQLKDTRANLQKELWGLQYGGGTALGPAVAVAIGQAGETPGSSVLLATDGLANCGVGNLENAVTKEQIANCRAFYEQMADYARERSVTVNVLSLASQGDNVNLSILGVLNNRTGGTIDVVKPETAVEQVQEAMKAEPIATNVSISLLSHRLFRFKTEEEGEKKEKEKKEEEEHVLHKDVGVVSRLSEIPFEFENGNGDVENLPPSLPFQVQIRYTKMDGTKAIRVITQLKKVTKDKSSAEANVNVAVLSSAVSKAATSLAAQGRYEEALEVASAHEQMLARAVQTDEQKMLFQQYQEEFSDINMQLQNQMKMNQHMGVAEDRGECLEDLRLQAQDDSLSAVIWNQNSKQKQACLVM